MTLQYGVPCKPWEELPEMVDDSHERAAMWINDTVRELRAEVERLTAERDAALTWARLWKRAARLERHWGMPLVRAWWRRKEGIIRCLHRQPKPKWDVIRRALGLDDTP